MDITRAATITLIKEEYENLPSFMKSLASWEDLLRAVEKFNSVVSSKKETKGSYYFRADEIPTLGLGHKEKAYTVLLTRMKKLMAETVDGFVSYSCIELRVDVSLSFGKFQHVKLKILVLDVSMWDPPPRVS